LSFCGAKTHESSQPASLPASLPACLRQTPSIRRRRIASNCRFAAITSGNSGIHAAVHGEEFYRYLSYRKVEKVKEA
jgi:hypothetical protein